MGYEQTESVNNTDWAKHWRLADEIYPSPFVAMPSIPQEALDYIEAVEKHAQALTGCSQTEQDTNNADSRE